MTKLITYFTFVYSIKVLYDIILFFPLDVIIRISLCARYLFCIIIIYQTSVDYSEKTTLLIHWSGRREVSNPADTIR